ncbi:MAG: ubiquinol-cytochrome c reductase iron-sulfur subunit [Gammaproteobacteria bacterium]|nr:ubiquinol-cytochrome c reductase iron-sulfur subunit [Gammaproteobacteria bacterium]CAJ2376359.1 MAG: Ubiquinol-cytochrome c reductase iron-sulfur subunit [Arenicellales bacterium IbO2]MDA7961175.1 ubiquinol-cytochrome c reductase iron-sulfur subunit [Gammaproteobacteria bacterium]MDA7970525.1 ubiquinol-cytochrome c reductase iron-sulfur subunit [Gammaproteobacteria bacterium]MDA7972149.1 ubiquinol-cytochrome c reductase iron-sulfur subunit [Gammaproteobacteria bacterium]
MKKPSDSQVDGKRRRLLTAATTGMGLAGTAGMLVPFAGSMTPSARARAAGAPVEVDISGIAPGKQITVEWRGKPVWIIGRSEDSLAALDSLDRLLADPASKAGQQPDYARNPHRSIRRDVLVLVGICTHLGCSPKFRPEFADAKEGAFLCACHGSRFDLAGRVYRNVPAPTNLVVPPHRYLSENVLVIGEDGEAA